MHLKEKYISLWHCSLVLALPSRALWAVEPGTHKFRDIIMNTALSTSPSIYILMLTHTSRGSLVGSLGSVARPGRLGLGLSWRKVGPSVIEWEGAPLSWSTIGTSVGGDRGGPLM